MDQITRLPERKGPETQKRLMDWRKMPGECFPAEGREPEALLFSFEGGGQCRGRAKRRIPSCWMEMMGIFIVAPRSSVGLINLRIADYGPKRAVLSGHVQHPRIALASVRPVHNLDIMIQRHQES